MMPTQNLNSPVFKTGKVSREGNFPLLLLQRVTGESKSPLCRLWKDSHESNSPSARNEEFSPSSFSVLILIFFSGFKGKKKHGLAGLTTQTSRR